VPVRKGEKRKGAAGPRKKKKKGGAGSPGLAKGSLELLRPKEEKGFVRGGGGKKRKKSPLGRRKAKAGKEKRGRTLQQKKKTGPPALPNRGKSLLLLLHYMKGKEAHFLSSGASQGGGRGLF